MANRADFAPELGALKTLRPFVFWAQTTLPTVFDDSLSYYEVLTKLCKMVNTMLENEDTNAENIKALAEAYQELEDFTNNYFENLDVTQEINDKLDALVADGTIEGYVVKRANTLLNNYLYGEDGESGKNKEINDMISEAQADIEEALANFATRSNQAVTTFELNSAAAISTFQGRVDEQIAGVSTIVKDWMDDNFTNPSSVVIDDTLTVKDAAAEAYATGKLMDDATNMVLATSYWQDYVVDSVSGSFILADVSGGSNPAVGTGAPSKTLYIANVTPGETYIVSGVASSYSTTRYTPAYALGNLTHDASDNPYYEFYDVYPRGWDESQDPGTVYQYVRNQTVRIPTGTTPTVTHLFIVGDSRVPITVRCSRLNARTDTALTSETLPAQGKATGDALETKLPWPVSGGNKDLGTAGYGLVTNADGTTSWQEVGGDYDEEIENLQNDVVDLKSFFTENVGKIEFDGSRSYSGVGGAGENWPTFIPTAGDKIAIILSGNTTEEFEVSVHLSIGGYPVLGKISDNDWHVFEIPNNVSTTDKLLLTYKGTTAVTISCRIVNVTTNNLTTYAAEVPELRNDIEELKDTLGSDTQSYGQDGTVSTSFQSSFLNYLVCPCKKVVKGGKVKKLYVKSYSAGTTQLYVGTVDQLYLFVPRASYDINVTVGEQTIDVSSLNIFITEGEQVSFRFIDRSPFVKGPAGNPEGDNSFYYAASSSGMQLQVYGAQYAAIFGFGYTVESNVNYEQDAKINENTEDIEEIQTNISTIQSSMNVLNDRDGNKYKMIVQNGDIVLLPMNFSHVLCVGNSYTTHPTTTDVPTDYKNNLWWGHWSMAASTLNTAWTTLLQNALRQKNDSAVVTPVFGRRYETNPTTYNLSNSNTFTYWTGSTWASLKDNVSNFSDVDAVVFFLGANYHGDDWYTLYSDMVEQFITWFPNASLFCCSCGASVYPENDATIQQVASEELATYISMVGINAKSKIGSYVYGDDNNLHQINNSAVAGHFGDYGEYLILNRVCGAMGYSNNTALYNITVQSPSNVTLSVISKTTISGAVVSVFADVESGTTLSSITVTDASNNAVAVTDHGTTPYGRVFTFTMPSSNVTITGTTA